MYVPTEYIYFKPSEVYKQKQICVGCNTEQLLNSRRSFVLFVCAFTVFLIF